MKCVIAFSVPLILFVTHLYFQHSGDLSHVDVRAMHEVNGGFDKNDIYVPQYDYYCVLTQHQCTIHSVLLYCFSAGSKCLIDDCFYYLQQ